MTTIRDLDPLPFFPNVADVLLSVGWLAPEQSFPTGPSDREFYQQLKELIERRFEPIVSGGGHSCELCQFEGPIGGGILYVPSEGQLLAAPSLIAHYIASHHYLPPARFRAAVLACPDPSSMAYKKAFLASGGREFLRALKQWGDSTEPQ